MVLFDCSEEGHINAVCLKVFMFTWFIHVLQIISFLSHGVSFVFVLLPGLHDLVVSLGCSSIFSPEGCTVDELKSTVPVSCTLYSAKTLF
jgi:hypothetical protein